MHCISLAVRRDAETPSSPRFLSPKKCHRERLVRTISGNDEVEAVWAEVYKDTETHWDLYELAEKLVDVEDNFQQWRFRHMTTVKKSHWVS